MLSSLSRKLSVVQTSSAGNMARQQFRCFIYISGFYIYIYVCIFFSLPLHSMNIYIYN